MFRVEFSFAIEDRAVPFSKTNRAVDLMEEIVYDRSYCSHPLRGMNKRYISA